MSTKDRDENPKSGAPEPGALDSGSTRSDSTGSGSARSGSAESGWSDENVEERVAAQAESEAHGDGAEAEAQAESEEEENSRLGFPVVGIGASAGGLHAFEQFFKSLPDDSGMAFVLIQHLAPNHESELAEILQNHTRMKVAQVEDATEVRPNCVYVIPPGKNLEIESGVLKLSDPVRKRGYRAPIDFFFRSLAEDQGENAVCIVLSGTGSDGTLGVKAVKERAGVTMVQSPGDAEYDGMPQSAVRTGLIDFEGTAAELAEKLVEYRNSISTIRLPVTEEALPDDDTEALTRIFAQLRERTGHDFTHYKRSTILRRIGRRLQVNRIASIPLYLNYLRRHPDEANALFKDFLISVTNFYRDPKVFEVLEQTVIPRLFENKKQSDVIRVWVPGCATGEEAFTIAILLFDYASTVKRPPSLQVFATDIDEDALAVARTGFYPDVIASDIRPDLLKRYFAERPGGYEVKKNVREIVLFAAHNILKNPPFSRLDLVSCRNLLIYLNRDVQEKVFGLFHYALLPEGYLLLGSSESAETMGELFKPVHKKARIYQRRDAVVGGLRFPPAPSLGRGEAKTRREEAVETRSRLESLYKDWTLRHYAPPRLIVDEDQNIVYIFGDAGAYLQDREGPVTQHILHRVLDGLRLDLRAALYEAFSKGKSTDSRYLRVEVDGEPRVVRLHVGPITDPDFPPGYAEVVFLEIEAGALEALDAKVYAEDDEHPLVARLEDELQRTRARLQAMIEEHETSNEELKASNEELQSMNEELQSTGEELETSKEELQSMNEELVTVNQELRSKIDELSQSNSDLQNLMASTEVGTLFLDRELRLQRYTPRATDVFHIISSDLGRPFGHIAHQFEDKDLADLAEGVLQDLVTVEREVRTREGEWFILRMFPYRTVEDRINGVVVTLIDVTKLKRAEAETARRVRQQEAVAELGQMALEGAELHEFKQEATRRVAEVLDAPLAKVLKLIPEEGVLQLRAGVGWSDGLVGTATVETDYGSQAGYTLLQDETVRVEDFDVEDRFTAPTLLTEHDVKSGMSTIIRGRERPYGVFGVHDTRKRSFSEEDGRFLQAVANVVAEAVERKEAEEETVRLAQSAARRAAVLNAVIESMPDAVYVGDLNGVTKCNTQALRLSGVESVEELRAERAELGRRFQVKWASTGEAMKPEEFPFFRALHGEQATEEIIISHGKTGDPVYLRAAAAPVVSDGEVIGAVGVNTDITERVTQEKALRESARQIEEQLAEIELLYETAPVGLAFFDEQLHYVRINQRLAEINGVPIEDHHGRTVEEVIPSLTDQVMPHYERVLEQGEPVLDVEVTGILQSAPGVERHWLTSYYPVNDGSGAIRGVSVVVQEITEMKRVEASLRERERELQALMRTLEERVEERTHQVRRLASDLTLAEQRERRRIAQILHDDLQQLLYGVQIKLKLLTDDYPRTEGDRIASQLDTLAALVTEALSTTRTLSVDLSPPVLEDEGLRQAMQWLALHMKESYGLDVDLRLEGEEQVRSREMHVLLFQLVRELLFNVVKHAGVRAAGVHLRDDEDGLVVVVEDDGVGFDPKQVEDENAGFGLYSIRERLGLFGGELQIRSASGEGTQMTIRVPLDANQEGQNGA